MSKTVSIYWREYRDRYPDINAHLALSWARESVAVDELAAVVDWDDYELSDSLIAVAAHPAGFSIRVYLDELPYDWGDIEPTEQERESLQVIGVGVRLDDDDSDLDAIWGWGYLDQDGQRNALQCAHTCSFIELARLEIIERDRLAGYVETV